MTTERKRHLSAAIGSEMLQKSFVETKISTRCDELKNLSKINEFILTELISELTGGVSQHERLLISLYRKKRGHPR